MENHYFTYGAFFDWSKKQIYEFGFCFKAPANFYELDTHAVIISAAKEYLANVKDQNVEDRYLISFVRIKQLNKI
jgi:hypothetical protein